MFYFTTMKLKQIFNAYHVHNVFYSGQVSTQAGQMKRRLKYKFQIHVQQIPVTAISHGVGVLLGIFDGCVQLSSPNPNPIKDQNM